MNKLCKSKISLGLYIVAALLGILFLIMLISSIAYISNYAASYGVSIGDLGSEAVTYILGNSINYLIFGIIIFAAGRILDVVTEIKAGLGTCETVKSSAEEAVSAAKSEGEEPAEADVVAAETSEEAAEAAEEAEAAGEAEELPAKGPVPPLYTERSIFNY